MDQTTEVHRLAGFVGLLAPSDVVSRALGEVRQAALGYGRVRMVDRYGHPGINSIRDAAIIEVNLFHVVSIFIVVESAPLQVLRVDDDEIFRCEL